MLHRHLLLEKKKKDNTIKKEDQILTVTEESVETNSGQTKIIQYFIVVYDYFPGQPEKLEPPAATDEEERFLIPASIDTKSGWKVG